MKFTVKLSMMALALVQMIICSCAVPDIEESTVNLPEKGETVFSAVMELTKTLPSAGGIVSWTEDDEIGIFDGTSYVKARILSIDGGKVTFAAKVDASADRYVAVTPFDAALSDGSFATDGSKVKVVVGSSDQKPGLQVASIAEISSIDKPFAFKNIGNILRFQINSTDVQKVRIVGNKTEMLGGTIWVDPSSGASTGELTVSCLTADVIAGKDSFIALGPGVSLPEGFTITFYGDQECTDCKGRVTASNPLVFAGEKARNQMINLGALDNRVSAGKRDFYIFDCWSAYKGKPDDMSADKFSKCLLAYESFLLGDDMELDMFEVRRQIQLAKLLGVSHIFTDIEDWYSTKDGEAIKSGLTQVFNEFKNAIPGCTIGNYGVPVSDLNVRRYSASSKNRTEEEIQAEWISSSQRRMPAAEVSDALFPSMYTHTDGSYKDPITQYEKDVKITADFIRANFPEKKIYAYIWPQFYNQHTSPNDSYQKFMTKEQWTRVLEVCYENFDGVILWSHGKGPSGEEVVWADSRVQDIYAATKDFVSKHYDDIAVAEDASRDDVGTQPDEFEVFADLGFNNVPRNLLKYGVQPINLIKESDVSGSEKVDGVLIPDLDKIKHVAKNASLPVVFLSSTWLSDRSTNNAGMVKRYSDITEAFKSENKTVTLGYRGVGPTALTELAAMNYATEYDRMNSWLRYAVEPSRVLRQFGDVICPIVSLINDDLDYWENDSAGVLEEARYGNPDKKIYACLGTTYYNSSDILKEETLLHVLEYLYLRCDGVILFDSASKNSKVDYSEDLGFMKALDRFYTLHKNIIDKTLPPTVDEDNDVYEELIINGGFEDPVVAEALKTVAYNTTMERLPRVACFFDDYAQTTHPTMPSGTEVTDGSWFHRCSNNSYYWYTYVADTKVKSSNSAWMPIARTGDRSLALYVQDGGTSAKYQSHVNNLKHLFALGQTLALNDTRSYTLNFWWCCPEKAWSYTILNNAKKIIVGIVSSTGADKNTDYTWKQEIDVTADGKWHEQSVTFNLPEIIKANPGKSFNECAIFFYLVPELDADQKTVRCQVNFDDVSLHTTK